MNGLTTMLAGVHDCIMCFPLGMIKMPTRKKPQSLKEKALRVVISSVTSRVRMVMSSSIFYYEKTLSTIQTAISSLPPSVSVKIVEEALICMDSFLGDRNNHPAVRLLDKLLVALLPSNTNTFRLNVAQSYPLRMALLRRIASLSVLKELHLSANYHLCTSTELSIIGLRAMKNLVDLRIPWVCSDEIIGVLGESCPELQFLDARESGRVTSASMSRLSQCKKIKVLLLTGCSVSESGYETILISLPKLEKVGRCRNLTSILERVKSVCGDDVRLELTAYESDNLPGKEVEKLCPNLSMISVTDASVVFSKGGLEIASQVTKLMIDKMGCRTNPSVLNVELSKSIVDIDLTQCSLGCSSLMELDHMCPGLRVLKVRILGNEPWGLQDQPYQNPTQHTAEPFQNLEEMNLFSPPGHSLIFVLRHAKKIRVVKVQPDTVGDDWSWTDTIMSDILSFNPMTELEEFVMCKCLLTISTVFTLMTNCQKLRLLRDLKEWKITDVQIDELKELIKVNNWDLQLDQSV